MALAKALKSMRNDHKLLQVALARELNVCFAMIYKWKTINQTRQFGMEENIGV